MTPHQHCCDRHADNMACECKLQATVARVFARPMRPNDGTSIGHLYADIAVLKSELATANTIIDASIEVLRPFADDGNSLHLGWDNTRRRDTLTGGKVTVGDCRRAANFVKANENRQETPMSSGGVYPTMREQIDALESKLAASQSENGKLRDAINRIGFSVMRTSGEWSIHGVREYDQRMEADDLKRVKRIVELESELRDTKSLLATEREARQAAESSIAAIPAICRGEPAPCALHVSHPITEMRTNKDAAYASLEADYIAAKKSLVSAHSYLNDLTRVSGMTSARVVRDRNRAVDTLMRAGYTDHGGNLWKPPLGKLPDFDRIDKLTAERDDAIDMRNELGTAIGVMVPCCLRVLLLFLPEDAVDDRETAQRVLARVEAAMEKYYAARRSTAPAPPPPSPT